MCIRYYGSSLTLLTVPNKRRECVHTKTLLEYIGDMNNISNRVTTYSAAAVHERQ